jgi:hypothetical protein
MTKQEAIDYCDPTQHNWENYWTREWRLDEDTVIVTTEDEYGEITEERFNYEQ